MRFRSSASEPLLWTASNCQLWQADRPTSARAFFSWRTVKTDRRQSRWGRFQSSGNLLSCLYSAGLSKLCVFDSLFLSFDSLIFPICVMELMRSNASTTCSQEFYCDESIRTVAALDALW